MDLNNFFLITYVKKAARPECLAAFLFFLLLSIPLVSQAAKKSRLDEPDLTTQYWVEAFDFFETEGDLPSLEALRTKALEKQSSNIVVIKRLLDSLVRSKDRKLLLENMISLVQKNSCTSFDSKNTPSALCLELKQIWTANLDSIFFYEETAGKIEKARRALQAKECDKTLGILREIEQREGSFVTLVDLFQKSYLCLADDGNRVAREAELQKLRIFSSQ